MDLPLYLLVSFNKHKGVGNVCVESIADGVLGQQVETWVLCHFVLALLGVASGMAEQNGRSLNSVVSHGGSVC